MRQTVTCEARRQGDQMQCRCGLAWDVKDTDPPQCRKGAVGNEALGEARKIIAGQEGVHLELISLKEMPLRHLPAFGIRDGIYLVNWTTEPQLALVMITKPHMKVEGQGRRYMFYSKAGMPVTELLILEDYAGRRALRRNFVGSIPSEWVAA